MIKPQKSGLSVLFVSFWVDLIRPARIRPFIVRRVKNPYGLLGEMVLDLYGEQSTRLTLQRALSSLWRLGFLRFESVVEFRYHHGASTILFYHVRKHISKIS